MNIVNGLIVILNDYRRQTNFSDKTYYSYRMNPTLDKYQDDWEEPNTKIGRSQPLNCSLEKRP